MQVFKQGDIKPINECVIFRHIHMLGPISRTELSNLLNLSKQTISNISNNLISRGYLAESYKTKTNSKITINPSKIYSIGIYLTKDKLIFSAININNEIMYQTALDTKSIELASSVIIQFIKTNSNKVLLGICLLSELESTKKIFTKSLLEHKIVAPEIIYNLSEPVHHIASISETFRSDFSLDPCSCYLFIEKTFKLLLVIDHTVFREYNFPLENKSLLIDKINAIEHLFDICSITIGGAVNSYSVTLLKSDLENSINPVIFSQVYTSSYDTLIHLDNFSTVAAIKPLNTTLNLISHCRYVFP